jgi:transposase
MRREVQAGVKTLMDKHEIIRLKQQNHSIREIARLTGFDRKTITRHWKAYLTQMQALKVTEDVRAVQERIVSAPKYNASNRRPTKYNDQIDQLVDVILAEEKQKDVLLGNAHKQRLTNRQIHRMVQDAGYDIGQTVLGMHLRQKREAKAHEAFVRQEYEYGQRLEYDFGEVKLVIAGQRQTLHMAVLSSPKAQFRWAYLYKNQKKEVFLDSHVRFFEMAGGVYEEIVYDNMRNVVTRFIGKNEKQLNPDLLKMSLYYGFQINVTNCYRGNEKGYVESSVKALRNQVFALRYRFESVEEAEQYLADELVRINAGSLFPEEQTRLKPYRPRLELAQLSEQKVDKYSFVRVDNNFYSVPEYLVGRKVLVKAYAAEIVVYSSGNKVCSHQKKEGFRQMSVQIHHYLDTLQRKPNALKNSVALKSQNELKTVFDRHFTGREREFIAILKEHAGMNAAELVPLLLQATSPYTAEADASIEEHVTTQTRSQLRELSKLFLIQGGRDCAH